MNTLPKPASQCRLTLEFHRDVAWWRDFLNVFNGSCDFHNLVTNLQTDACSEAIGASFNDGWMYSNLFC